MLRVISEPRIVEIDPAAPPPPRVIGDSSCLPPHIATPRPRGVHTKHLTELDRFRVRTLYYDACLSKGRIQQITGYSESQIRTAVRAKTAAVGKRPGRPQKRPKRRGRKANNRGPSPDSSDEEAELIRQAQEYFDRNNGISCSRRAKKGHGNYNYGGYIDEEDIRAAAMGPFSGGVPASSLANAALEWGFSTATAPPPMEVVAQPPRISFNDLPSDIRTHIWRCVLSTSPAHEPPSRSWALTVLSKEPWLELGMAPPDVKIDNPPWSHYVEARHVPATVLTRVNREARAVVLERCTPVLVPKAAREASDSIPLFIWIDRESDVIHYVDEEPEEDLFELAGKCACPELYRRSEDES